MRDSRPIYGPWQIFTKEEEHQQIIASLNRENYFNRRWYDRKESTLKVDGGPCTSCNEVATQIRDGRHWCPKH